MKDKKVIKNPHKHNQTYLTIYWVEFRAIKRQKINKFNFNKINKFKTEIQNYQNLCQHFLLVELRSKINNSKNSSNPKFIW